MMLQCPRGDLVLGDLLIPFLLHFCEAKFLLTFIFLIFHLYYLPFNPRINLRKQEQLSFLQIRQMRVPNSCSYVPYKNGQRHRNEEWNKHSHRSCTCFDCMKWMRLILKVDKRVDYSSTCVLRDTTTTQVDCALFLDSIRLSTSRVWPSPLSTCPEATTIGYAPHALHVSHNKRNTMNLNFGQYWVAASSPFLLPSPSHFHALDQAGLPSSSCLMTTAFPTLTHLERDCIALTEAQRFELPTVSFH